MFQLLTNLRPEALPSGFQIFGITIKFYSIIILSGALLTALYGYLRFGKKIKLNNDTVLEGLAFGLFFGVLGARIYYVIFEHESIHSFWEALNPRGGGLAIHGAIIATAIYLPIFCKIKKIPLLPLLEVVVPIFLMSQVIGRWGNFMNQEAFGPMIDTIGGLTIDNIKANAIGGSGTMFDPYVMSDSVLEAQRNFMHSCLIPNFIINQMYVEDGWILLNGQSIYISGYYHPTFLYESLMNLAIVIFMNVGRKYIKHYYVGDSLPIYLMGYGVVRFIIESMRTDPLVIGHTGIKIAQVMSILFVIGGLTLLILRRVFKWKLVSCYDALYKKDDEEVESPKEENSELDNKSNEENKELDKESNEEK